MPSKNPEEKKHLGVTLTPEQVKNLRELFGSLHDKYQHYGGIANDSYLEKFNEILEE